MIDGFFTPKVCCFAADLVATVHKTAAFENQNQLGSK